jgi:hypothetical protein
MNELLSLITDVDILVNGKPVKKYSHKGKIFIEAREGTEYSIRVKNGTWNRILAIAAVDGINVLDGKAAGSTKAGYVLHGWNSYEIKGFRTSNDAVNAFKFSKKNKSYAAKSDETGGDTSNCGVIGVQFYSEKPAPVVLKTTYHEPRITWHYNDFQYGTTTCDNGLIGSQMRSYNAGPERLMANYCASVPEPTQDLAEFDLGTEFSKKEIEDKVQDAEFEIGSLYSTFEIYYASRESLEAMGVPLFKTTQVAFPKAFPNKFCKPPRD